jgi:DNA-binding YbaB/EbfC family protein
VFTGQESWQTIEPKLKQQEKIMFKGIGNIASLVKQAQTMGPKMQEALEALKTRRVSGTAGGGMVTVHADGVGNILSVEIDPILEEKKDLEMIKDLLPAAINQAIAKQKELHMEAMQGVTGDLPLPGNMEDMLKNLMGNQEGDDTTQPTEND